MIQGRLSRLELRNQPARAPLELLCHQPSITRLDLTNSAANDDDAQTIACTLPGLRWLSLAGTQVTDWAAVHLAWTGSLETLGKSSPKRPQCITPK